MALPDDETRQLFESNDISSVCTGSDSLFIGSNDGYVSILGKGWKVIRRFQAHEARITHMRQVEGTSLLVTIAVSHLHTAFSRACADCCLGGHEQRADAQSLGFGQAD